MSTNKASRTYEPRSEEEREHFMDRHHPPRPLASLNDVQRGVTVLVRFLKRYRGKGNNGFPYLFIDVVDAKETPMQLKCWTNVKEHDHLEKLQAVKVCEILPLVGLMF